MLINGLASDLILNANGEVMTLVYSGATKGWVTVGTVTADYPKTVLNKPFFHAQDQKAYNVDGGSSIADAWTKRPLNTVIHNDIQGASLGTNEVNLPAGTYYVEGSYEWHESSAAAAQLAGIFKDGSKALQGKTFFGYNNVKEASVSGLVTLSASGVIDLRYHAGTATATTGLGKSNNTGSITDTSIPSIYADLKIWQLDRNLEIAPKAVNSGLQTIAGMNTEGGIMGGDVTVSGNTLTITKCSCMSSDLEIPMATTVDSTVVLPGTVNQEFYIFMVRLVAGGTFTMKAYTTYAGPTSDVLVDRFRFISYAKNNGSGVTMPFKQVDGEVAWLTSNRPILTATTTGSYVSYNLGAVLPAVFTKVTLVSNTAQSQIYSYDGTTAINSVAVSALEINYASGIYINYGGGSTTAIHLSSATLRR
jgi:hypothetical protein